MSVIDAIKAIAKRVAANIVSAVERLTTQNVIVTIDGEIVVQDPAVKAIADKVSAFVLASAALFFLLSPLQSRVMMEFGDQLMRTATMLWSGTEQFAT
jgi:hypothetical protein